MAGAQAAVEVIKDAASEIHILKVENLRLRAQLDAAHAGMFVSVVD